METIRLVNSYGDVVYGVASRQPQQKRNTTKGLTEGSGSQRAGHARTQDPYAPGTFGPNVSRDRHLPQVKLSAPVKASVKPPVGKGKFDPKKAGQALLTSRVTAAENALKVMVGWSTANKNARIQYSVTKSGLTPVLYVKGPQDAGFVLLPKSDSRWLATVAAAAQAYATEKGVKSPLVTPSAATPATSTTNTTSTTSDTPSSASETPSGTSGGTSTPSWFSKPYLNEMLAASGWKGPSFNMPGVTFEVKTITLDGASAPAIAVTSSTGTADVTPAMAEWAGYAANVIPSKAEDDQRKASGTPAPSTSGGGSSARVTSETTSGDYSIWASDSVPSSDSSAPATKAPGSGGSSMRVVEDAPATFAPSGEEATAPEAVTLVSGDAVTAEGEEGFFAKNKWYIAGGTVALLGGYAYMHRMNPTKYPLPDYLSKWVR
jgi:hypothetical protein